MASNERARANGFATPSGTDLIRTGDNDIAQNARAALDLHDRALATIDNFTAAATTLPYGQPATATITGELPDKVINIGIPKGMPDDVGAQLVASAEAAQESAATAQADAAASLTLAQQAQAAALEVPDNNVSALIGNPATLTREALDDLTRPAAGPNPLTGMWHAVDRLPGRAWSTVAADNTAAIQASIDEAPPGARVYLHGNGDIAVPVATGIQLRARVQVVGQPWLVHADGTHHLEADGPGAIFQCGVFTPAPIADQRVEHQAQRDLYAHAGLINVSARNVSGPVATIHHAQNFLIENAQFRSESGTATIAGRYCYRSKITGHSVVRWAAGATPLDMTVPAGAAIDLGADANGVILDGVICGGGIYGAAIKVERSYDVVIDTPIIESSKWGVMLATSTDYNDGAGTVTSPSLRNVNTEAVLHPITLGTGSAIHGGVWHGALLSVGGTALDQTWGVTTHPRTGMVHVGDVQGMDISGINMIMSGDTMPPVLVSTGGAGAGAVLQGCNVWPFTVRGYGGVGSTFQFDPAITSPSVKAIGGTNQLPENGTHTGVRTAETPTVTANVGLTSRGIIAPRPLGGRVLSVDLVDVEGDLTGATLRLGIPANASAHASIDLGTVTISNRAASLTVTGTIPAGAPEVIQVVAGSGAGTFRVRLQWHGS